MKQLRALCRSYTGQFYTSDQLVLVSNRLQQRYRKLNVKGLDEYVQVLSNSTQEEAQFISLSTIHTTSWFREGIHYELMQREALLRASCGDPLTFHVLCAACSTGPEVYSAAFVLEEVRRKFPCFDYLIHGFDVDPVSVQKAKTAVYKKEELGDHLMTHKKHLLFSNKSGKDLVKVNKEIRKRCLFKTDSLLNSLSDFPKYDWIFCRNALIYFDPEDVLKIIRTLKKRMKPKAFLCLGHSDHFDNESLGLKLLNHSLYKKVSCSVNKSPKKNTLDKPTKQDLSRKKVLIVDDSATVRRMIGSKWGKLDVEIFQASGSREADLILKKNAIDLMTVDLYMPEENGDVWLRRRKREGAPTPVSILLSEADIKDAPQIYDCLTERLVVSYLSKSRLNSGFDEVVHVLRGLNEGKVKSSFSKETLRKKEKMTFDELDMVLIGASTGGTNALSKILMDMPKCSPPICVVQHITPDFSLPFAERLGELSGLRFVPVNKPQILERGCIYLSTTDCHLELTTFGENDVRAKLGGNGKVAGHSPSVSRLFQTASQLQGKRILAILLTGMGSDGAKGLLSLREKGAYTITQDEASCVVYGMPKVAADLGASCASLNLEEIQQLLHEKSILRRKSEAS